MTKDIKDIFNNGSIKEVLASVFNLKALQPDNQDPKATTDNTKNYELIAKITNEKIDILKNVEWFNNLISEKNKISKLFL